MQHVAAQPAVHELPPVHGLLGFGFDNYDATGAFITTEDGKQVDSSGMFMAIPDNAERPDRVVHAGPT